MSTDSQLRDLRRDEQRLGVLSGIALGAILTAVAWLKPGHTPLLPECLLHRFTGFFCPGCGSTRALYLLLHGAPLMALSENAFAVLLLPILIYDILAMVFGKWKALSARISGGEIAAFLSILILFAIARNIPVAPFVYLRPIALP